MAASKHFWENSYQLTGNELFLPKSSVIVFDRILNTVNTSLYSQNAADTS